MTNAEIGQAYQRRYRKHHGDHRGRHEAEAEEENDRQHVDERVNHLHGVQHRANRIPYTVDASAENAYRNADYGAEHNRNDDHAHGKGGFLPVFAAQQTAER